jgi:solute carrier family 25 S-adenosylmethionine transporter 26
MSRIKHCGPRPRQSSLTNGLPCPCQRLLPSLLVLLLFTLDVAHSLPHNENNKLSTAIQNHREQEIWFRRRLFQEQAILSRRNSKPYRIIDARRPLLLSEKPYYSHSQYSQFAYAVRVGLSGGLAGALGTLLLFPLDASKTMRQANPSQYASVRHALVGLLRDETSTTTTTPQWHIGRAYRGWLASTLGAIPSSALYFGTYETVKRSLQQRLLATNQLRTHPQSTSTNNRRTASLHRDDDMIELSMSQRLTVHALAAASGNLVSSLIFVPKELIKQRMQFTGDSLGTTLRTILLTTTTSQSTTNVQLPASLTMSGFYRGWQTTLLRNIPSAVLRFCIYEELKRVMPATEKRGTNSKDEASSSSVSFQVFVAGALAGAIASGLMTPVDVLKTRLSTGTCPVDVPGCVSLVLQQEGWKGLYAGAGSRMIFSGAFSAIGFGTFEAAKLWLDVGDEKSPVSCTTEGTLNDLQMGGRRGKSLSLQQRPQMRR